MYLDTVHRGAETPVHYGNDYKEEKAMYECTYGTALTEWILYSRAGCNDRGVSSMFRFTDVEYAHGMGRSLC